MGATTDQFRNVAPSIPVLTKDQEDDMFDGVMHAGDYAYDFAPYGGRVGDMFMNLIQPFASRVPYMAGVGNHESGGSNRKHFAMRFAGMQYVAPPPTPDPRKTRSICGCSTVVLPVVLIADTCPDLAGSDPRKVFYCACVFQPV